MKPGWNPIRRNRNIGTAKQGRGQENRLVIPNRWHHDQKHYYERLGTHQHVHRNIHGKDFIFVVEETRHDCVHACTIDDLFNVLWALPGQDLEGMARIVLRQPTRKEQLLAPCWGRLAYMADFDDELAPAIVLDAGPPKVRWRWSRSMGPEIKRELERLESDGHRVTATRRDFIITADLESVRATQLYRTLPHEVGHWVDWLESVKRPRLRAGMSAQPDRLDELYDAKSSVEKEVYAHRYADEFRAAMTHHGRFPFEKTLDLPRLKQSGLRVEDFVPE